MTVKLQDTARSGSGCPICRRWTSRAATNASCSSPVGRPPQLRHGRVAVGEQHERRHDRCVVAQDLRGHAEDATDRVGQRLDGGCRRGEGALLRGGDASHLAGVRRAQEVVLALDAAVDRADGDPAARRHLGQSEGVGATLDEQGDGGIEGLLEGETTAFLLGLARVCRLRSPRAHGTECGSPNQSCDPSATSMRDISRLMFLTGRSPVTLATSDSGGAGFTSRRHVSQATERLTMTFSITQRRRRSAAAVALPVVAGMLLTACGSGDSGRSSSGGKEPQTITFTYAPANAQDNSYEVLAQGLHGRALRRDDQAQQDQRRGRQLDPDDPDAGGQRPGRHGAHRRLRPGRHASASSARPGCSWS